MDVPWKKVLKLSQMILGLTALAPVGAAVGAAGDLIPDDDDDDDEQAWIVKTIPSWKLLCRGLMDIPMEDSRRGLVLQGRLWSDWFSHYGKPPKHSWIEKLSAEVVMAVKAEMASTISQGS